MKVGDLVVLSEYGFSRNYNDNITKMGRDHPGLVVKIEKSHNYPYKVKWVNVEYPRAFLPGHSRRELKYVRSAVNK